MITGEGGFIHRSMPPVDWDCGPIPEECSDESLSLRQIKALLRPVYLEEGRVRRLADSDDPRELFCATIALDLLVDIDAEMIWLRNHLHQLDP